MSKHKAEKFDRESTRFLRRVHRERPTWDQVGAVVACLVEQMSPEERAEAGLFAKTVHDRCGAA